MKAIDDGVSCVELAFGVKQFVNYFDQQGQFNYEVGKFAGEIYRYGKSCVAFPKDVMTAVHGAAGLLAEVPTQKRQLVASSTPKLIATAPVTATPTASKAHQCKFCLSDSEFFAFF